MTNFLNNLLFCLKKLIRKECRSIKSLNQKGDLKLIFYIFAILTVGGFLGLGYLPPSLRYENINVTNINAYSKINQLRDNFGYLCFLVSYGLAQIPLEYFDAKNQELRRNLKSIIILATSVVTCMNFYFQLNLN